MKFIFHARNWRHTAAPNENKRILCSRLHFTLGKHYFLLFMRVHPSMAKIFHEQNACTASPLRQPLAQYQIALGRECVKMHDARRNTGWKRTPR
jgi:hypothetical protein